MCRSSRTRRPSINLNATGANSGNTVFIGPFHGSLGWSGDGVIQYTPAFDYVGGDLIVYAATVGGTQTLGMPCNDRRGAGDQVNVTTSDAAASEEGPDAGAFTISRLGDTSAPIDVLFAMAGSATPGDDYTLSHSSPVTIPTGQSSVVVTLTPVDDTVFGEGDESAILNLTPDAAYPIGLGSATVTIADNDNHAPEVNAGPDQMIYLEESQAWTPASIATAAWYDAADATTITQSSGSVSQWNDKSGNGNHATQSNASNRPVTGSRAIGGKNALEFSNAGSQSMSMPALDIIGREAWAVFVLDSYATTASQLILGGGGNVQVGVNSGTQNLRLWCAANPYSADTKSTATVAVSSPTLAGWLAHTDTKKFSINGTLQTTGDTYNSGSMSATNIGRGQYAIMDGAIGEIVVTSGVLSTDDRQRLEGYLAHKWGLESSLPADHPYKGTAPGQADAVVSLNGSADDADGNSMAYLWGDTGTGTGTGESVFSDPTSLTSTVSFDTLGTYILSLTADDGQDQTSDFITITVNPPLPGIYASWAGGGFTRAFNLIDPVGDQDLDGASNIMEFAFGTDPTVSSGGVMASDGSTHGLPSIQDGAAAGTYELFFIRRDDHGSSGSVSYTVQFSGDLQTFYNSATAPTFVADSSVNSAYEVVKVAYPATLPNGQPARFGRIEVGFAP